MSSLSLSSMADLRLDEEEQELSLAEEHAEEQAEESAGAEDPPTSEDPPPSPPPKPQPVSDGSHTLRNTRTTGSPMMEDDTVDTDPEGFSLLETNQKDMINGSAFNEHGDRFATAGADGKIQVFNLLKDGTWKICDTWRAHYAEVIQVQWLSPRIHPHLLASIGTDGRFKIWVEDPTIAPNSGRRFNSHSKPVFELRSESRAPYLSFSITHNAKTRHTYLALINRNATLVLWENEIPTNLEAWTEIDRVNVCDKPARGDEVSFKVQFDPNLNPCFKAIEQGVPQDSLGILVASMTRASIWRTKEITHNQSLGNSPSKELYLAVELKGHKDLVRGIAWAFGNIRGYDTVATACKDGWVRVFEITTPEVKKTSRSPSKARQRDPSPRRSEGSQRNAPSGIGAGLAGARQRPEDGVREGEVVHVAKEVSRMEHNKVPVWKVDFDPDGQMLASSGDDGKVVMWRREPSGIWSRSAELSMKKSVVV